MSLFLFRADTWLTKFVRTQPGSKRSVVVEPPAEGVVALDTARGDAATRAVDAHLPARRATTRIVHAHLARRRGRLLGALAHGRAHGVLVSEMVHGVGPLGRAAGVHHPPPEGRLGVRSAAAPASGHSGRALGRAAGGNLLLLPEGRLGALAHRLCPRGRAPRHGAQVRRAPRHGAQVRRARQHGAQVRRAPAALLVVVAEAPILDLDGEGRAREGHLRRGRGRRLRPDDGDGAVLDG